MKDEELHLEICNPKTPFEVIDDWGATCLLRFGYSGDRDRRIYFFSTPKDLLLFRLKWL